MNVIRTVAGTAWLFQSNGKPAINAPLGLSKHGILDANNNLIFSDTQNSMVFRVDAGGILQVIAGNGISGFSGDGGPAVQAQLSQPSGIALDAQGDLYIVDVGNSRIRKVDSHGIITTIAGTGFADYGGDNGPAINAAFDFGLSSGITTDVNGNVFVIDYFNGRIRKITPDGSITTIAGNGTLGYSGDNGPALKASFDATDLLIDGNGNILVTDTFNHRIRQISPAGMVTTIAGTGTPGRATEGASAASAPLDYPYGLFAASDGTFYFCDSDNNRVLHWTADGTLHTVAGGVQGYSGDGGPGINAGLYLPEWVVARPDGSLFIGDFDNWRVRALSPNGTISTFAGNGGFEFSPDGSPATAAFLAFPWGVAVDGSGNVLIADTANNIVRKVDTSGNISTIAGTRRAALGRASGGLATATSLNGPYDLAVDTNSNILVLDHNNQRLVKVTPDGHITTVAGNGDAGFSGDGGPAVNASFNYPDGLALDNNGNIFVADTSNNRIRKITPDGTITTIAGTRSSGLSGDGGPASNAKLYNPEGVAVDTAGNLYIADSFNNCVRKVTPNGTISRFAGTGIQGFSGDGGQAVNAKLDTPNRVAVAQNGTVYISDSFNNVIRAVTADGVISTVVGNGQPSSMGDGGDALLASINVPVGIALDNSGTLYIAENFSGRVRAVSPGTIDLQVSPTTLTLSAQSTGAITAPVAINVSSSTPGLPFTVSTSTSDGAKWLQINADAGLAPGSVSITADPTGLSAGTYTGTVSVSSPPVVRTVAVTLNVASVANAKLSVNSNPISFALLSGAAPSSVQLLVSNTGAGSLAFNLAATAGSSWLSFTPASGTAKANSPAVVNLTATPGSLPPGTYTSTLTVSSPTTGETTSVPITMTITAPAQVLLISQTGLRFRAVAGGGAPLPQAVSVLNVGSGSMNWSATATTLSGGSWLQLGSSSGTVSRPFLDVSPFNVIVDASGLSAGDYYGTVLVQASGVSNPQTISVVLNVLAAGTDPGPEVRPTGLVFTGVSGATPGSQTVSIAQLGSSATSFNSSQLTLDGTPWFVSAPTSGAVAPGQPATIVVQPDFTQLQPGVRFGQLSMVFGSASGQFANSVVSILTVVAPPSTTIGPSGVAQPHASSGCSPSALNMQMTNNGQQISGVIGQPVPIEVKVVDNCGSPITNSTPGAAVYASFTTSDPQLSLSHISNGMWAKTWQPKSQPTQSAIATITAFEALPNGKVNANQIYVPVTLTSNSSAPFAFNGGVGNAASFQANSTVSPGQLISIFGSQLADQPVQPSSLPLPTDVNGTAVMIGQKKLPIVYAGPNQLNLQVPFDLPVNTPAQIVIQRGNTVSVPDNLSVAPAQPAIFTKDQNGHGQGVIVNAITNQLAEPGNPVSAGTAIVIYCTGLGALNPPVQSGVAVATAVSTAVPATVSVGGQNASVLYSGLTPNFPGLYQINAIVPNGVTAGDQVPVTISIAGQTSPPVTIAVQ